jgi:hypothetical protein
MKTAIYIEDGITQLVLTPENEWETRIIDSIDTSNPETSLLRGGFYECQGGWTRQDSAKRSLIIRTKIRSEPPETP